MLYFFVVVHISCCMRVVYMYFMHVVFFVLCVCVNRTPLCAVCPNNEVVCVPTSDSDRTGPRLHCYAYHFIILCPPHLSHPFLDCSWLTLMSYTPPISIRSLLLHLSAIPSPHLLYWRDVLSIWMFPTTST